MGCVIQLELGTQHQSKHHTGQEHIAERLIPALYLVLRTGAAALVLAEIESSSN